MHPLHHTGPNLVKRPTEIHPQLLHEREPRRALQRHQQLDDRALALVLAPLAVVRQRQPRERLQRAHALREHDRHVRGVRLEAAQRREEARRDALAAAADALVQVRELGAGLERDVRQLWVRDEEVCERLRGVAVPDGDAVGVEQADVA